MHEMCVDYILKITAPRPQEEGGYKIMQESSRRATCARIRPPIYTERNEKTDI